MPEPEDKNYEFTELPPSDPELEQYISTCFKDAYERQAPLLEETAIYRELCSNKESRDYLNVLHADARKSGTHIENLKTFRSGLGSNIVKECSAIQTAISPRILMWPYLKEVVAKKALEMVENPAKVPAPWITSMMAEREIGFDEFLVHTSQTRLNNWQQENGFVPLSYRIMKESKISGYGIAKMRKNRKKKIILEDLKIENVCWDEKAASWENCRFIFHHYPEHTRAIEMRYKLPRNSIIPQADLSILSGDNQASTSYADIPENAKYKVKRARLVEGYFKDPDVETCPNGRRIIFVLGQGDATDTGKYKEGIKVLKDEPWQYESFPIFIYVCEPDTETSGKSLMRDIAPLNIGADMVMQTGIRSNRLCGIPKIVTGKGNIVNSEQVNNNIAGIVELDDIAHYQILPPIAVAGETTALYDKYVDAALAQSGLRRMSSFQEPVNSNSARAMLADQDVVGKILKPSTDSYKNFWKRIFKYWGELELEDDESGKYIYYKLDHKTLHKLPFALNKFIDGFEVIVTDDTAIAQDASSRAKLIMELAAMRFEDGMPGATREDTWDALGLDNVDVMKRRISEQKQVNEIIQGLTQQAQNQAAELEAAHKALLGLQAELEDARLKLKAGVIKGQTDLELQAREEQGRQQREMMKLSASMEQMRQQIEGMKSNTLLQAAMS